MDHLFESTSFLIVDNASPMRLAAKAMLVSLGAVRIHQATNGSGALRLLDSERIDVVLSDLNMTDMSGIELLAAMREKSRLKHVPFILITAEANRERIRQAVDAGVAGILVKPFSGANLLQHVSRALNLDTAPGSSAAANPAPSPEDNPAAPQRASILVVDDTPDNLDLLTAILRDDYRVRVCNSGKRALAACQSDNPPDLILLDVMMPEMDGFEVARLLREHPTSEHIPVIFVTALADDAARLKGLSLCAVDFVTKPVNPDELKMRVRNFMRYIDLRRQLQADYDAMIDNARLRENVDQLILHDLKDALSGILDLATDFAATSGLSDELLAKTAAIEQATLGAIGRVSEFNQSLQE